MNTSIVFCDRGCDNCPQSGLWADDMGVLDKGTIHLLVETARDFIMPLRIGCNLKQFISVLKLWTTKTTDKIEDWGQDNRTTVFFHPLCVFALCPGQPLSLLPSFPTCHNGGMSAWVCLGHVNGLAPGYILAQALPSV